MVDRLEQHIGFYRNALNVRTQRQELLASNIANADTPHFKARDLDFKAALGMALGRAGSAAPLDLARTSAQHLGDTASRPFGAAIRYRTEFQGAVDGNTVNMDVERAAFAENTLHVDALITLINRRFRGLETAIKGQ